MNLAVEKKGDLPLRALVPLLVSLALFHLSAFFIPAGLITAAPLYYAFVVHGLKIGAVLVVAGGVITSVASGFENGIFFVVLYGVMSFALAGSFFRRLSFETTVMRGILIPFIACAFVGTVALLASGETVESAVTEWADTAVSQAVSSYKENGGLDDEVVGVIEESRNTIAKVTAILFPLMVFASVGLMVFATLLAIRIFSLSKNLKIHPKGHSLSRWALPDWFVWLAIVGGAGVFLTGSGIFYIASLNILLASLIFYTIQGLGVIQFFFTKMNTNMFLKILTWFFLFAQPLLLVVVCCAGIADVWADFRKINRNTNNELAG